KNLNYCFYLHLILLKFFRGNNLLKEYGDLIMKVMNALLMCISNVYVKDLWTGAMTLKLKRFAALVMRLRRKSHEVTLYYICLHDYYNHASEWSFGLFAV